jgi:hypothetical protein
VLRSKTLLFFLLKAAIIYGVLSLPLPFYDAAYGKFYRKLALSFYGDFRETGFVKFREMPDPVKTRVNLGNKLQIRPGQKTRTAYVDINTRYLGYIPTILIASLVLASPVPWKRRLIALAAGLFLVTLMIMFKQWIALLWLSEVSPFLELTHFTGISKKILTFFNTFIAEFSSSLLYFVVGVWLLVTFRISDFKGEKA